jgi:galactose mutarotase-like enzyme
VLDDRGLPAGRTEAVDPDPAPLGERTYDDLFVALEQPAVFAVEGGGRRIELELGQGYPFAQVYAPDGSQEEPYICFEPMTAPVNALVSGDGLRSVPSGGSFRAEFSVRVQD